MKKTNEKNLNERACANCGCVYDIDDMLQIENAYFCSECATVCECGSSVLIEDLVTVNRNRRDEQCACNRCIHTSDFFVCRSCGGLFTQNHYWGCYNDESICDNCSNNYVACEQCDRVVLTEDAYYEDESRQYLCYECFHQSIDSIINDYYYKPCPVFHGSTSDNGFLGVELEVDNTTDDCSSEEIKGCARALISNYSDTLKHTTFIAALQFVVVISEYAKNTKLADIPFTKWKDIFMSANFNELNEYLNERGLN